MDRKWALLKLGWQAGKGRGMGEGGGVGAGNTHKLRRRHNLYPVVMTSTNNCLLDGLLVTKVHYCDL